MADIKIVKLKIRRGTDSQRRTTLLDQGELGYTTDTKRLFVGNGVLSGGINLGSKVHPPLTNYYSLSNLNAEVGDIVVANNLVYQLTGANYATITHWANISQRVDPALFEYDANNQISLKDDSIPPDKLDSSLVGSGLIVDGAGLRTLLDSNTMIISAGNIAVKAGGIGKDQLNTASFTNGISGGSGLPVGLQFDPTTLYLKFGTHLSISAFPADSVTFNSLDSSWFGSGLIFDTPNQKVKTVLTDVDAVTISKDLSGKISLLGGLLSGVNELAAVTTDTYGRVLFNRSAIYDTVSCIGNTDALSPLSSLFTGSPDQFLSGVPANLAVSTFNVISSNPTGGSVSLILSSAGFLMFEGETTARQDGKYVGRFAIPIFSY
jgi:hypothetical protein